MEQRNKLETYIDRLEKHIHNQAEMYGYTDQIERYKDERLKIEIYS